MSESFPAYTADYLRGHATDPVIQSFARDAAATYLFDEMAIAALAAIVPGLDALAYQLIVAGPLVVGAVFRARSFIQLIQAGEDVAESPVV